MKIKRPLLLILCWVAGFGFALPLAAQNHEPRETNPLPGGLSRDLPGGVLLARAPNFFQWTITYTHPGGKTADSNADRLTRVVISKTLPTVHYVAHYKDKSKLEAWINPKIRAVIPKGRSDYELESPGGPAEQVFYLANDYIKIDFPELNWVADKTFVGAKDRFLFFKQGKQIAIIDAASRLPVRLYNEGETLDYQFQELPQTVQAFPVEVAQYIERRINLVKAYSSTGPRPY